MLLNSARPTRYRAAGSQPVPSGPSGTRAGISIPSRAYKGATSVQRSHQRGPGSGPVRAQRKASQAVPR